MSCDREHKVLKKQDCGTVARSWLDQFEGLYNFTLSSEKQGCGDVSYGQEIKKWLECKPFQWYSSPPTSVFYIVSGDVVKFKNCDVISGVF